MASTTERDFISRQQVIRQAMLGALYEKRKAGQSGFSRDLTHTLGHDPQECVFALEFLVEMGLIRHESIHCRITAQGITYFEQRESA